MFLQNTVTFYQFIQYQIPAYSSVHSTHCENHKTRIIIFTRKDTLHGYCLPHPGPVYSILHTYVLMKLGYQTDKSTMYYVTFSATIFSSLLSILQFWHCSVHTDSSFIITNCNIQRKMQGVNLMCG